MNRFESKYYNTSLLMNQALIELLNKKDYEFITVKEICKKAGVNRSTFYLHYSNVDELLCETIENINKNFLVYFENGSENGLDIKKIINGGDKNALILVTPEYLLPYLNYIKENKTIYRVSAKYPVLMQSIKKYNWLQKNVLYPIFDKFDIKEGKRKYFSAYYVNGIFSIIDEWIKDGCKDEVGFIIETIEDCVRPFIENYED